MICLQKSLYEYTSYIYNEIHISLRMYQSQKFQAALMLLDRPAKTVFTFHFCFQTPPYSQTVVGMQKLALQTGPLNKCNP